MVPHQYTDIYPVENKNKIYLNSLYGNRFILIMECYVLLTCFLMIKFLTCPLSNKVNTLWFPFCDDLIKNVPDISLSK